MKYVHLIVRTSEMDDDDLRAMNVLGGPLDQVEIDKKVSEYSDLLREAPSMRVGDTDNEFCQTLTDYLYRVSINGEELHNHVKKHADEDNETHQEVLDFLETHKGKEVFVKHM